MTVTYSHANLRSPAVDAPEPIDELTAALDDLLELRATVGDDAVRTVDAATARVTEVRRVLINRRQAQISGWQQGLADAGEDVRRELGRWAIRAQRTPGGLMTLADEIERRRHQLTGPQVR